MIIVETTSDSKKVLKKISANLLQSKLTACVHITKISNSSYIWKGKIESKKEYKMSVKTIKKNEQKIIDIIQSNHNYKVFELSKYTVSDLNSNYTKWFKEEIK